MNNIYRGIAFSLLAATLTLYCQGCGSPTNGAAARGPTSGGAVSSGTASSGAVPEPADSNAVKETTFDDIKFELKPDAEFEKMMLTTQVNDLFEKRIRIRGYIYPPLTKNGIKKFILVRDNLECCFGPGAALFDCILVHMEAGKTAKFTTLPVEVQGKFTYEEFLDWDGTIRAIYRLDGESVE